MFKRNYQIMPELTAEEYDRLKKDIEENGCKVPVDVDEDGIVLDGYNRVEICNELGIEYETRVISGLSEEEKIEHALRMNVVRRQLPEELIQELISNVEEEHPDANIQKIAEMVGIDDYIAGLSASATIREDDENGDDPGDWDNDDEEGIRINEFKKLLRRNKE